MNMTREEIAKAVEMARERQGLSYRQLAKKSGRDLRAVQSVCKGWYNYGIDTLLDIARAVELEVRV